MEALSSLLNDDELSAKFKGVKVVKGSSSVNYCFFAYDSIVFCRAKVSDWQSMQEIYEVAASLESTSINLESSSVLTPIKL